MSKGSESSTERPVGDAVGGKRKASGIEQRHSKRILGRLLCYDRIVVNGTLQRLQNPAAIAGMLRDKGLGAFDLKEFARPLTEEVRRNAMGMAKEHGVSIQFVRDRRVRKEELVRAVLDERGDGPGLVCILSAMENCSSFAPRKAGGKHRIDWIKVAPGRCLHYYFYFIDERLGLMHVRVPTWMPFRLQFNFNGHNWLARRMEAEGIDFVQEDNAFTVIGDWERAQELSDAPPVRELEATLQSYAGKCCPATKRFGRPHLSISQAEVALDIAWAGEEDLLPVCERLCREAMMTVRTVDMARYFGKRLSPEAEATSYFRTIRQGMYCVRHQLGKQGLKVYNKGSVLRIETTSHDITFYRHHRKVEKKDGTSEMKVAPLKKQLGSIGDLYGLMADACRRYLEHISQLEDPDIGRHNLDKITRPKRDKKDRSWRGVNFFLAADMNLVIALQRGEACISGLTNKRLRGWLGGRFNSGQVGRMLRRLREHKLIRRVPRTFKYYLSSLGKRALVAALKIREHLIIPALQRAR